MGWKVILSGKKHVLFSLPVFQSTFPRINVITQSLPGCLNRLGIDASLRRLAGSSPTRGGRLVTDARDQQPFTSGEWGLESCSLRAFLREPPCGTCKKDQAGIWLQDYWSGSPDQNKTMWHLVFLGHTPKSAFYDKNQPHFQIKWPLICASLCHKTLNELNFAYFSKIWWIAHKKTLYF